jgi:DNA polymerase-3 subunit gamma/tau
MLQRRSLDLVEIDGASNNSVDDVRELRERVNLRPAEGRQKVFIIDEVHMLSIGAFNALLKTLEEPPDHVLFALATTELQKVPATVRSRCQMLELRPIPFIDMVARLRHVCGRERISADDDVLRFITLQSTGSLRDALSLLEQIRAFCGDVLQLREVETALGVARITQVASLAGAMAGGDLASALTIAGDLMDGGVDPRQLTRQLTAYWREALVGRARQQRSEEPRVAKCRADQIVPVLHSLMSVESATRRSDSPRWALETAIADATLRLTGHDEEIPIQRRGTPHVEAVPMQASARPLVDSAAVLSAPAPPEAESRGASATLRDRLIESALVEDGQPVAGSPKLDVEETSPLTAEYVAAAPASIEEGDREMAVAAVPPTANNSHDSDSQGISGEAGGSVVQIDAVARWPLVMRWLHENRKPLVHHVLQKVVVDRMTTENEVLVLPLRAADSFHRGQIDMAGNRKIIEDAVSEVFGGHWSIRCVTIDEPVSVSQANLDDLGYLEQIHAEVSALSDDHEQGV